MKKVGVFFTIFLIYISFTYANYYDDWYFKDEAGTAVTNVKLIGWRCDPKTSTTCTNVNRAIPFTIQSMPVSSGTTNHIKVEYTAATSTSEYFIVYAYNSDYQIRVFPGWLFSTYRGPPLFGYKNDEILYKKDNCKADFTLQVQSCAEAGMPLSILTDTKLSASTASAFIPVSYYWPPEFNSWLNVSTKVTATVKKQGATADIFTDEDTKNIYAGTTEDFSFLWQTSKNTDPGNYVITMNSYVLDTKCDLTNSIVTPATMTVYIAASLDGCVAQVQNFRLEPTSPTPNTAVLFKGEHLHTYQNWSWDDTLTECNAGNAQLETGAYLPVTYALTIKKRPTSTVVKTLSGNLPANTAYTQSKAFVITWTPLATECGEFTAELKTQSTAESNYACSVQTLTTTATKDFNIGNDNDHDTYYDLCGDCNDANSTINPGAVEKCGDNKDNDCNGLIDGADIDCGLTQYYCNADSDTLYSQQPAGSCSGTTCVVLRTASSTPT